MCWGALSNINKTLSRGPGEGHRVPARGGACIVTAVAEHHCGAWIYELRGPDGLLMLDAVATVGGQWQPHPDGRTAVHGPDPLGWGHAEHRCVPDGQGELL